MRVLITGAAGFLGRAFARHHWAAGDFVFGVDDLSSRYSHWPEELPGTNRIMIDAGEVFENAPEYYDLAYHFAAPVGGREKIEGDPLFNADSLRLDSAFFRWAIHNTRTAVFPSSSAVYGTALQTAAGGQALGEKMFHPDTSVWYAPDEMYGFTKLAGEVLAWKSAAYGLNVLCIRPFSGYGEDQSLEYPVPSIAQRVARRETPLTIWGSGLQTRDFVHIDDVVGATTSRLAAGIRGYESMNIGSGVATNFLTVASMMVAMVDGYNPVIEPDTSKPVGVARRWSDITQMSRYYEPKVSLTEGLERVLRAQEESWLNVAG